jgi:hypothetical protein
MGLLLLRICVRLQLHALRFLVNSTPPLLEVACRVRRFARRIQICLECAALSRDFEGYVLNCLPSDSDSSDHFTSHQVNHSLGHDRKAFLGLFALVSVKEIQVVGAFT